MHQHSLRARVARHLRITRALAVTLALVAPLAALTPASAAPSVPQPVGGPLLGTTGRVVVDTSAGAQAPPKIAAQAYLLADLDTGAVLLAYNAHQRLRPASTLKTLTAVTLLPQLDPSAPYVGTWDDANAEGSRAGIYAGGQYTVDDLFNGLFLPSGNDAAHALAMAAGGLERTVAAMNAKAGELGALDTHAVNPSGLDADGQFSSAYDLALFARAGLHRPDFATYVTRTSAAFPGKNGATFKIQNQNKLLYHYDGALGVKTGYTTKARSTYVGAAGRGGHRLVVTLLKSPAGSWKEAVKLLDWGFANYDQLAPVGQLVEPVQPPPAPVAPSGAGHAVPAPGARSVAKTTAGASGAGLPVLPLSLVALSAVFISAHLELRSKGRRPGGLLPRR